MATDDTPHFEGTESERGQQMLQRMAKAGVKRVSELSTLHGQPVTYDGATGVIDYVGSGRFRCTLEGGRQPWGLIEDLVEDGTGFTYTTPEG